MRDAYEHEVKFIGQSVMVFQLRGHPWTVIYRFCKPPYDSDLPYPVGATAEDAYIPALFVLECPNLDEKIILRLENLNRSDLERMDYVAYR
ncbi:hypothetical protein [Atlanticothrix silvestris]|nr:hypothetical protein [Atlanticothrix silvestris]